MSQATSASSPAAASGRAPGGQLRRVLLLVPCGLAMLMGVDAALALLGLPAPLSGDRLTSGHGMLMVIGFVGALIALERSVAIKRRWAHGAPVCMALGSLLTLVGPLPVRAGRAVMVAGCLVLCVNYVVLWSRNREPLVAVQIGGGEVLDLDPGAAELQHRPGGAGRGEEPHGAGGEAALLEQGAHDAAHLAGGAHDGHHDAVGGADVLVDGLAAGPGVAHRPVPP